jgi:hypothetical protein
VAIPRVDPVKHADRRLLRFVSARASDVGRHTIGSGQRRRLQSEGLDDAVGGKDKLMQCPLCGGPLHLENPEQFRCARGHELAGADLAQSVASRVSIAFWMAIEALDSEAEALRVLSPENGANDQLAAQAAEDASVLRKMAGAHLAPLGSHGDGH